MREGHYGIITHQELSGLVPVWLPIAGLHPGKSLHDAALRNASRQAAVFLRCLRSCPGVVLVVDVVISTSPSKRAVTMAP
jgi:hypothetical protein